MGADVAAGLRSVAAQSMLPGQWERLAVCWHLAQTHGLAIATLMRTAHRDVVELANSGDADARRMIRDSGRHVGEVLAGAVNLLNPAVLVVAGDMVGAYDIFAAGLRETLYGNATALATRALQVVPSMYGNRSAVIGSAAMVLDHVLSPAAIDASLAATRSRPWR